MDELGADVNARNHNGGTPVHHAAARGDNEMILYLVEQGADVTAVARSGQTAVDMATGPVQRIQPFVETIVLQLEPQGRGTTITRELPRGARGTLSRPALHVFVLRSVH